MNRLDDAGATPSSQRRVVVTGIGMVNPLGVGREAAWSRLLAGGRAIGPIRRFDPDGLGVRLAGEVSDFEPLDYAPRRLVVKSDRFTHFAMAATELALGDAALSLGEEDPFRVGIAFGNNSGGWDICERGFREYYGDGPHMVNPWQATAWFPTAAQGYVSIRYGVRGVSKTFACDRASGACAVLFAHRAIRWGHADVVLAGGAEAPITRLGVSAHIPTGDLSTESDPDRAFLPFDRGRAGLVMGEGAAVLVLEELSRARARGARIYGELRSVQQRTCDPADHEGLHRAASAALDESRWAPGDVDAVFAEGCATPAGDRTEAAALGRLFGTGAAAVTVPKAAYGHLYGAALPTELAFALLAMGQGVLPGTAGTRSAGPDCGVRLVLTPTAAPLARVLLSSRSREGTNVCLTVSRGVD